MRQILLATAEGPLGPKSSVGGEWQPSSHTPEVTRRHLKSLLFLFPSIPKPFLSFDQTSFQTIGIKNLSEVVRGIEYLRSQPTWRHVEYHLASCLRKLEQYNRSRNPVTPF